MYRRCKGTLDVRVRGNTIVPHSVLGRFSILCAILRQVHLILQITLFTSELKELKPDVFFVDQLSAGIPLLRRLYSTAHVLFYCHFPDKLLAKQGGILKKLYRGPFDWIESWSTGCSDSIVVNSNFTKSIFGEAFPELKHRQPGVVYPCVDIDPPKRAKGDEDFSKTLWEGKKIILSINRFEKKKDVALAVKAFAGLTPDELSKARLVVAGGYDPQNTENHSTYNELVQLCDQIGLKHATAKTVISALSIPQDIQVLFLHSVPNAFKTALLSTARLLVYTPLHEHFGIVPLEAMLAGTPVLAANEGGPTETVVNDQTGWLRPVDDIPAWTAIISHTLSDSASTTKKLSEMGNKAQKRVKKEFSKSKMAQTLDAEIQKLPSLKRPPVINTQMEVLLAVGMGLLIGFSISFYRYSVEMLPPVLAFISFLLLGFNPKAAILGAMVAHTGLSYLRVHGIVPI